MGLSNVTHTKGYRNFMAKVYGWGASIVLIGAMFKINHWNHADILLIVGLGTEAIIFFFSAFEPPHVEPDWSMVYPELKGIYHGVKGAEAESLKSPAQRLNDMLDKAKIDQTMIDRLGQGIEKMADNASKLADVSDVANASNEFAGGMKVAASSAKQLGEVFVKDVEVANEYSSNVQTVNNNANMLANAYEQATDILKNDMNTTEAFASTVKSATESANSLADSYQKSAEILSKSVEALDFTAVEGESYNQQLRKIAENLAALNAIYEIQLQGTNKTVENNDKMQDTVSNLLAKLEQSSDSTSKFAEEMEALTKRMSSLNKVYGNMLSAMSINA